MQSFLRRFKIARVLCLAVFGLSMLVAGGARAEFITALVSGPGVANALVTINTDTPELSTSPLLITGTTTGIIDIDYRPANGLLYGLGRDNRIYTIDTTTGVASVASTLGTSLSGSLFGIDFNPVADRLRIVSDIGQNLRVNVATGGTTVDGPLNQFGIVAAGYTNSVAGATSTRLYDVNYVTDTLAIQAPPNNGTLTNVGPIGIDAGPLLGFDISGLTGIAYGALNLAGSATSSLWTIDLATGDATQFGSFGGLPANFTVRGIAVFPVPEPASLAMVGIGLAGVGVLARRRRPVVG